VRLPCRETPLPLSFSPLPARRDGERENSLGARLPRVALPAVRDLPCATLISLLRGFSLTRCASIETDVEGGTRGKGGRLERDRRFGTSDFKGRRDGTGGWEAWEEWEEWERGPGGQESAGWDLDTATLPTGRTTRSAAFPGRSIR